MKFAIPQVNLLELVRLEAEVAGAGIELVHGAPVHRLRGRLLPLAYLNRELALSSPEQASISDGATNIVVLQADERQFGLIVDSIHDTEEIVVKPLSKQLRGIESYAGATIMGDRKVALILDVLGLAKRAGVISEVRNRALAEADKEIEKKDRDLQTFILFAGPDNARMALPLGMLSRLEEFPVSQIEKSGLDWVAQYRGQILPLIRLGLVLEERRRRPRHVGSMPASGSEPVQVLVLNHDGQSFGLVVENILDIVEDRADVKSPSTRAGIACAAVIDGRVVARYSLHPPDGSLASGKPDGSCGDCELTMAETLRFCTFYLDKVLFGVELQGVQEVIHQLELTKVPLAPAIVGGLMNLRGQIVTAIDLRRRLELSQRPEGTQSMNVVVRTRDGAASLLVDEIGDVVEVDAETFESPPETLQGKIRSVILGVHKLEKQLMHLLDIEKACETGDPEAVVAGP
jgi:chemotaxis signal transduction protein